MSFQYPLRLTACVGLFAAVGYQIAWIVYSKRDDDIGFPDEVYLYFGFLLWLAAATTAFSYILVRRSGSVVDLLDVRRKLLSESLAAGDRERQKVAEYLHDGPLQDVLAARLDIEEVFEKIPHDSLKVADFALREAAASLRSTVGTLHPQVLAHLGLSAALRDLVEIYKKRHELEVVSYISEVGHFTHEEILYGAARELLSNAVQHSRAERIELKLSSRSDVIKLQVSDNGIGFDFSKLSSRISEGHIGLASHAIRVENIGGEFHVVSQKGKGTHVKVCAPYSLCDSAPFK